MGMNLDSGELLAVKQLNLPSAEEEEELFAGFQFGNSRKKKKPWWLDDDDDFDELVNDEEDWSMVFEVFRTLSLLSNQKGSEVILSSGAIGSPQMMLLSGIGPKKELQRLKIPLVLENEYVGKGMADNPINVASLKENVV